MLRFLMATLAPISGPILFDASLPTSGAPIRRCVQAMGDPTHPVRERYGAAARLRHFSSTEPIPILIEALSDPRVFDPKWEAPSGSPEDPPSVRTVGEECSSILLYCFLQVSVKHGRSYRVDDWPAWWGERRGRTLEQIRREVRDVERSRGIPRD